MSDLSRRTFLAVGGSALIARWLATPCYAALKWQDSRSHGPFQLQATFPLGNLAPLFEELSALELELQRTLAVPPTQQKIDVYLVNDQQAHKELLAELYPRVPYRRALYVQRSGQGFVYAYRHPELPVDLRHECTHSLLHASLPMVPLWLDEGLAEYFEVPALQRAFDNPHLAKVRWHQRFGMVRSVESLEDCGDLSQMGTVEYRFAWAWAHFMLHGPLPAHRELVHFLNDIQRGNPPGMLSRRLRNALPRLEDQFANHFRSWSRS
jgi:hypothetical protein